MGGFCCFRLWGGSDCLQNQRPRCEPMPFHFSIWAGFTVFGLFSTYLIIGGWGARTRLRREGGKACLAGLIVNCEL